MIHVGWRSLFGQVCLIGGIFLFILLFSLPWGTIFDFEDQSVNPCFLFIVFACLDCCCCFGGGCLHVFGLLDNRRLDSSRVSG